MKQKGILLTYMENEVFACDDCENITFILCCDGAVQCAKCEGIVTEKTTKKELHQIKLLINQY